MKIHFIGAGGSGMSALAQVSAWRGNEVTGSDRNFDRGLLPEFFQTLQRAGIRLFPQDGSAIDERPDRVVYSTAVEAVIPDLARAKEAGIALQHRSELLAEMANGGKGVAISGTSGKSTITGMTAAALEAAGLDPTVISGGDILNYRHGGALGNARAGKSDWVLLEADESDGTLVNYRPEIGLIANVQKDHKPIEELEPLFRQFAAQVRGTLILNAACPRLRELGLTGPGTSTYSLEKVAGYAVANLHFPAPKPRDPRPATRVFSSWTIDGVPFRLQVPGLHNVENALAATAAALAAGARLPEIAEGLAAFRGIRRRMQFLGEVHGVAVYDDFAHNPEKVRAALKTLQGLGRRVLVLFQFHGYGPTRFLKDDFITAFSESLRPEDHVFFPEIYYAGGTAAKDISAKDIAEAIRSNGRQAHFRPDRAALVPLVAETAEPGDVVAVMGARDDTLTGVGESLLKTLKAGRIQKHAHSNFYLP